MAGRSFYLLRRRVNGFLGQPAARGPEKVAPPLEAKRSLKGAEAAQRAPSPRRGGTRPSERSDDAASGSRQHSVAVIRLTAEPVRRLAILLGAKAFGDPQHG